MIYYFPLALCLVSLAQAFPSEKLDDDGSELLPVKLDPCKDFYKFACQHWMENERLQAEDEFKYSSVFSKQEEITKRNIIEILHSIPKADDPVPVNQARQFYSDCINTGKLDRRGYEPLVDLSNRLGGWPMLNNQPLTNTTVMDAILRLNNISDWVKDLGFVHNKGLFSVQENWDPEYDTSNFTIYPPFILWDDQDLEPFSENNPNETYINYLNEVVFEIQTEMSFPYLYKHLLDQINKMIKFETRLVRSLNAKNFESEHSRQFTVKQFQSFYNNCPISESDQQSRIDWLAVLKDINQAIEVNENTKITIYYPNFFEELGSVLRKVDVVTVRNFMGWTAVRPFLSETTSTMRDIHLKYTPNADATREDLCSRVLHEDIHGPLFALMYAVGSEYVKRFVPSEGKTLVSLMLEHIREEYIKLIRNNTWMDEFTKTNLETKLRNFEIEIAYPDWILNKDLLTEYYDGLIIKKGKHLENYIALMNFQVQRQPNIQNISIPYWSNGFLSVSAWYDKVAKIVAVPVGVFNDPTYYQQAGLSAENFGAIGNIIGHEISRLIVSYLGYFKIGGVNTPGETQVWSNESATTANETFECYSDMYKRLALDVNITLGGTTLEEDVCDNLGFAAAYSAYRKWKDDRISNGQTVADDTQNNQKFYLSFAQMFCANLEVEPTVWDESHSPDNVRVNATIMNSPYFGEDWDCPVKSTMNPERKCYF